MNANRALWEKGDFTRIAETLRGSGEALDAGLGIGEGTRMLDLGCGDGTTAIPADMVTCDRDYWNFHFDGPPTGLLAIFESYYGPTINAFAAAAADGREAELRAELEALFEAQNEAVQGTSIAATFLLVNVSRP